MPPKKVCSDKAPLKDREWSVTACYKRGVKSGFVAGIQKGIKQATEQGVKRARIVKEIPQAALKMQAVRGVRKAKERVAQIAKKAETAAQERETELMRANDVNIEPPRVKPAGRRQKLATYYNFPLRRVADVVAPNPVVAPPAPIINIWDRVNRMGGKAQRGEEPTGGTRNRDELIAELVKNEPDLPQYTQGVSTLKRLGKRVLINLLVGTGKYERGPELLGRK
jgi:hypothetical protein